MPVPRSGSRGASGRGGVAGNGCAGEKHRNPVVAPKSNGRVSSPCRDAEAGAVVLALLATVALATDDRVFSAADFGAVDDGRTDSTAAFSACLDALIAAGGGRMVLPRHSLGVYVGSIIVPQVTLQTVLTVEIAGDIAPTPVFGTVGNLSLCTNCSHAVVRSAADTNGAVVVAQGGPGWSMVFVYIRNLEIRTGPDPSISGVDLLNAVQCKLENVFVNTAEYAAAIPTAPTHTASAGVVTPRTGNGAMTLLRNVLVTGFFTGIVCNEHTDGDAINVFSNVYGLRFDRANDASLFGRVDASDNLHHVSVNGPHGFAIQQLMIENPRGAPLGAGAAENASAAPCVPGPARPWGGGWCRTNTTDISDPRNMAFADINIWVVEGDVGPVPGFVKVGGANVRVRRIGDAPSCAGQAQSCAGPEPAGLAARLRLLSSLREQGLLTADLHAEAAHAELAAWRRRDEQRHQRLQAGGADEQPAA